MLRPQGRTALAKGLSARALARALAMRNADPAHSTPRRRPWQAAGSRLPGATSDSGAIQAAQSDCGGVLTSSRVTAAIAKTIERRKMAVVRGIIVHQTGGGSAQFDPAGMHEREAKKSVPQRFPSNEDSIGIELVGRALPDLNKPTGEPTYEAVTAAQNASLKWLIGELTGLLAVPLTAIFHHPDVSRKNVTEASSAIW